MPTPLNQRRELSFGHQSCWGGLGDVRVRSFPRHSLGDYLWGGFGDDRLAMNRSGVIVLAVVFIVMFFTAAGFFIGHVAHVSLDRVADVQH